MKNTVFIVNRNAANGSAARIWPRLAEQAAAKLGEFDVLFTERIGHATDLARQAAEEGAKLVVSVGGDGTLSEIVNGLMAPDGTPVNPETAVGQLCIGTGGDFRKSTGLPKDLELALDWLAGEKTTPIDVGRMEMTDHSGNLVVRHFANITSIGIGGDIDDRVNSTTKAFGGFFSFFWGSLMGMLHYKNQLVRLVLDDERDLGERRIFAVAVANGKFLGGGMKIAPDADHTDGLFEVVIIGDVGWGEKLTVLPKIYKGGHIPHPLIEVHRARKVVATSDEIVLLDVDGEAPGRLPTTFEICPGALRFKVKDD
jgi:YegS/Rv2252/BmrU family lipid kinase